MSHVEDRWYVTVREPDGTARQVRSDRHGQPMRYRARYTDPAGKERSRSFPDGKKREAERYAAAMHTDVGRGTWTDPAAARITLRAFADTTWYPAMTGSRGYLRNLRGYLDNHIVPGLGSRALADLAAHPSVIQQWVTGLPLSPDTARGVLGTLSMILTAAADDGLIARNPCKSRSVKAPARPRRQVIPWTAGRVAAVRAELPARYRAMTDLGAGLGMRQGEVIGFSPGDIDRKRNVVHVVREVLRDGGTLCFALPKGNRTREVPLPANVLREIDSHLEHYAAAPVTLPWEQAGAKTVTVPLAFTGEKGTVIRATNFDRRQWHAALKAAAVPETRENGFHALRHHFASVLLAGGADIRTVAQGLGHSDPGFTLRTYCHLMPGAEEKMRRIIEDAALMTDTGELVTQLEEMLGADGPDTD